MHSAPKPLRRQAPARRTPPRRPVARRRRLGWRGMLMVAAIAFVLVSLAWAVVARRYAPRGNTAATHFDAILVLGSPADDEGNPQPTQLARLTEGVHEYERGVAPRLLLTGGAAHNKFVESKVMARTAEALGVPASAIFLDTESKDTIQNVCYAARIMKDHGWQSAEVVSSAYHLPRAGLILSHSALEWRAHAAPPLEPPSSLMLHYRSASEVVKTVRYLLYADWAEPCSP